MVKIRVQGAYGVHSASIKLADTNTKIIELFDQLINLFTAKTIGLNFNGKIFIELINNHFQSNFTCQVIILQYNNDIHS